MKPRLFTLACLVALFPCVASASLTPPPSWTVSSGKAAEGNSGYAPTGKLPLVVQSSENAALPIECVFRFRAATGGVATFQATQADEKTPLLSISFSRGPGDYIGIGAFSSGRKMATDAMSTRRWFSKTVPTGGVAYHWRFDYVRNLWDDRDRAEIGSDYARLTPFNDKTFVVRLVVTPEYRQAWIDDRLIAEDRVESRGPVRFAMQIRAGATVVSETIQNSEAYGRFIPLRLDDYESDGREQPEGQVVKHSTNGQEVPLRSLAPQARDIDLGKSLWRYRLTHGTGPDAPYVNGMRSWPTPLQVDPDTASFRVPYRDYQNVWLVAWMDEKPCAVPRGTVSFFREQAGYVARSDFEVTPEAMSKGLVTRLGKDGEGRQLYLIRVPLDTEGLYRFIDMAGQFLDFQVTKPTYLVRSYPDPIYYGYHPGGEPSSIHVVSITMEESPFGFEVKPARYGHVFEQPEKPDYKVAVANHTADPLNASVRLDTTSFDGKEQTHSEASVTVKPGETSDAALSLHLHTLGWHQLKATVTADGVVRTCTLSLMILPPNTRTYGNAANETRFGTWFLAGHYIPLTTDLAANEPILALMHKMGIRRMGFHPSMVDPAMAKKYDLIPTGPHTTEMVYHTLKENDPVQFEKMLQVELGVMQGTQKLWPTPMYYYGGEWGFDANYSHAPNSRYVGKGPNVFSDVSKARLDRQIKIFTGIGRVLREKTPGVKLAMQWGSPYHEVAFMDAGFPKDLVDYFGIDAPIFELTPETPLGVGSINYLWTVRAEAKRLGWPRLPMAWCEGPFLPSWEGALTGSEQAQNYVRLWLVGMAYGVEAFEAGVVPFDTTNYYGAEHYGAGVFEGIPRECPKPAAAALATATSMVCGADVVGPVDTGVLTTYCLAFKHATTGKMTYALWRVNGTVEATISVAGDSAVVTDSMGNPRTIAAKDGKISVEISPSPVWLTGISGVKGFAFGAPTYTEKPAKITRPLPAFAAGNWAYSGSEDSSYENNHFGIVRVTDPKLGATFTPGEDGHADAAEVMLGLEPAGDSPMAARYGQLVLKKPVVIPGKATALGVWVKGNSGWGRIAFQIRDAKGELWTSIGTPNEWNCDDTYGWSRVSFEGWRYIRFPLPGNRPYDAARELDTTWWKSEKGDGIVDLPVRLERVFVEASNETIDLGEMKIVPDRTYKLAGMVAEYASDADASDAVLAKYQYQPIPTWEGPAVNPLAALKTQGEGQAPDIKAFTEPGHFNDGRQMVVRFDQAPGNKYNLYLSRYADGRGAERLPGNFTDNSLVTGLRPGIEMYLFLTTTGANGKESKPSFKLVTEDRFAEK